MAVRTLRIGHLYPEIMCAYGDRGNLAAVVRRCRWRGITAEVTELRLGEQPGPAGWDALDMIMIGHGGEFHQRLISADLAGAKGPGLRGAVGQGAAALAVGGGYELLGRFYQPRHGAELPGAAVFDTWTIQGGTDLAAAPGAIREARSQPAIGDLLVRWGSDLLVGFENHGANTYLGRAARPLGEVLAGHGNSGEGAEGVRVGGAVGTYLRGPCLPRNPALADFLIRSALGRRHRSADLEPLPDQLERAAHDTAVTRIQARSGARGRGGRNAGGR
jgi:lipid II isoglutaminyl synthase (glutamine-hydrolysing)